MKCDARLQHKVHSISGDSTMVYGEAIVEAVDSASGLQPQGNMYIMSMSYQPEFCYQHRNYEYPGCLHPDPTWKSQLTIHGLWPQFLDGSWPATCTEEKFYEKTVDDIGLDRLELYWPNVKVTPQNDGYMSLWEHEWVKHGTCTGLSQYDYIEAALYNSVVTPSIVGDNYGKSVRKADLIEELIALPGGDANVFVLVCDHSGKYLSEIRACLQMDPVTGRPGYYLECPKSVLNEENCNDDIYISVFANDGYVDQNDKKITQ